MIFKDHHKKIMIEITAFAVAAGLILVGVYYYKQVKGASYNFTQTDWSGGATTTNPVHPTNQTGWTYYESADIGVATSTTPGEIKLQRVTN